jgi:hypothetical protein
LPAKTTFVSALWRARDRGLRKSRRVTPDPAYGLPEFPGRTLPPPETVMSAPNPAPLRGYPTAVRASVVFGRTE